MSSQSQVRSFLFPAKTLLLAAAVAFSLSALTVKDAVAQALPPDIALQVTAAAAAGRTTTPTGATTKRGPKSTTSGICLWSPTFTAPLLSAPHSAA